LTNAISVRPLSGGGDMFVAVDRDVDVVKSIGQLTGKSRNPTEVRVQKEGHFRAHQVSILRRLGARQPTVQPVVRIRFPVTRKRLAWSRLMQSQRVVKQCRL
jgi:hypothetical protein